MKRIGVSLDNVDEEEHLFLELKFYPARIQEDYSGFKIEVDLIKKWIEVSCEHGMEVRRDEYS